MSAHDKEPARPRTPVAPVAQGARGARADEDKAVEAVALRYERGEDSAPELVAKGRGEIAEQILSAARSHAVPVREDADLLALLSCCELGQEIPAELYTVVAELLAYLYELNGEAD